MKKTIAVLFVVCATQILFSQEKNTDYKKLISKADSLYKIKDYTISAQNYSMAFKSKGWKGTSHDRYKAARSWSMAKVPDSAFYCLEKITTKMGYSEYEKIIAEEDFNSLHSDARWKPMIEKIKQNELPTGWFRAGDQPTSYQMIVDSSAGQKGKSALTIFSIEQDIDGFGTLMQNFLPDNYLGKRVRMTGYMKSVNVKDWAGFWLRADQENSKQSIAFDNMQDRSIKGTTDWKKYEIVLDIPKTASNIAFGALLSGTGQIWFEKIEFEIVGPSVKLTGKKRDQPNLDFEK
ncbi:MAG: hypothetical protein M3R27_01040 [Bacteroidota bacterium]|nr:hypothetical protein [Bacteroidota bacterium]